MDEGQWGNVRGERGEDAWGGSVWKGRKGWGGGEG